MITQLPDDEWSGYLSSGQAFTGEVFQPGVGGQNGKVQLFNPVLSTIRIRLRVLLPFPIFGIAINTNLRRYDVPLTTFAPFAPAMNLLGSGGAAAQAEIRNETAVGQVGSPFWLILNATNRRTAYPIKALDWGHDLLPGQGIIASSSVGGFIFMGFMWAEAPL